MSATKNEIIGFYVQASGETWSVVAFEKAGRFFAVAQTEHGDAVTTVSVEALDEMTAVARLRQQLGASFINAGLTQGVKYAQETN